ncbi:MAG: DNA polymerase III subunit alpha [Desulfotomaculum sp.]|nr:DNA polymerase III subunit alpha [Desulfotomaculum sp.]
MSDRFVHLHLHTEYSLLDGAARIKRAVAKAKEMGMPALAITDHGAMFGVLEFYKECLSAGIKPILGCEMYIAPRRMEDRVPKIDDQHFHLVLLAENIEGYRNLMKLVSLGYTKGFYYKPRVDKETLAKYSKGLIALSACTAGEVAANIILGKQEEALRAALEYREIFGKDNFFLELQYHGMPEQRIANKGILRIKEELGIPIVITNDVHYIEKEDSEIQDILMCIQTGKTIDDEDRMKFQTDQLYLKSASEMLFAFSGVIDEGICREAMENTLAIAERVCVNLELKKTHLPKYNVSSEHKTSDIYLAELCRQGAKKRYADPKGELPLLVRKRLLYELNIISKMGFADYFLIVWDFINYAKKKGIPVGPGRGSAAGSIVAYCLGIVEVDPLKYGLLFERFLNPERVSLPDIDVDICQERRDEVIEYIIEKYGLENVAQIITFGTMAARAAVRDVGRVLNYPYAFVDKIAKMIPAELNITIERALKESEELSGFYNADERVKKLIDIASSLEGMPRHASIHAAGLVISQEPLTHHLPLYRTSDGAVTTQFDMNAVEELGLLKMDLLGLRNLTIISETLKMIKDRASEDGIEPIEDIYDIPLDDAKTYEMLSNGESIGVFQLESSGMRALMKKLKPSVFEDVVALVALYRPGPLGSGMVDEFIKGKHGLKEIDYFHKDLEPILRETYGVILYQEQVMKIAQVMAGYTYTQADLLRKAMGKKIPKEMKKHRTWFVYGNDEKQNAIPGAIKRGYDEKLANKIFDMMEYFAGYGFNKSHSVTYALLAYQTAYLKKNYTAYYMAALLTSVKDNSDKVAVYIDECKRLGLKVLPPDINESEENFCVVKKGSSDFRIMFGLAAVKNMGVNAVNHIIEERKNGTFKNFTDFCRRIDPRIVNKRALESLIKAGCFDSLPEYQKHPKALVRYQLISSVEKGIELAQRTKRERDSGQISLLDLTGDVKTADEIVNFDLNSTYSAAKLLTFEKEALGLYINAHPLDGYEEIFRDVAVSISCVVEGKADINRQKWEIGARNEEDRSLSVVLCGIITEVKITRTRRGDKMAFAQLEDMTGKCELILFPDVYKKFFKALKSQNVDVKTAPVVVSGSVVGDVDAGDEIKLRVDDIKLADELERTLYVRLPKRDEAKLFELRQVLKKYPGEQKAVVYYSSTKERELIGDSVSVPGSILEELKDLFGKENVAIKWKNNLFSINKFAKSVEKNNSSFLTQTHSVLCYNNSGYNGSKDSSDVNENEYGMFRSLLDF